MEQLLPDQLKALWQAVDQQQLSVEAFTREQERLLATHRQTWEQALLLERYEDLSASLLAELGSYMHCADMAEVQRHCLQAVATLKDEWHKVAGQSASGVASMSGCMPKGVQLTTISQRVSQRRSSGAATTLAVGLSNCFASSSALAAVRL
jgi:hypothetical protein